MKKRTWSAFLIVLLLAAMARLFGSSLPDMVRPANAVSPVQPGIPNVVAVNYLPVVFQHHALPQPTPIGPVGGTFTSIVFDPNQNDNIYIGSFVSGVYKSFNQGQTWYSKSVGLGSLRIQSLAAHPTRSDILYAGTYGSGLYKSLNAGESWFTSSGGKFNSHIVYDIEIDPRNPNTIYVGTRPMDSLAGSLYKSLDGGATWSLLLSGSVFSTPDYFYDIDVDPSNSDILYLCTHEHGFYKSSNGGGSFSPVNGGVTDLSARSTSLDSNQPGLVYGAVWHNAAMYRSWNSGASWQQAASGLPSAVRVFKVSVDPFGRSQKRVFASTYGNGMYASDNFGENWYPAGLTGYRIYDFAIADGSPQRWYAATESHGIFRSNNYGSGWKTIMGDLRLNSVTVLVQSQNENAPVLAAVYGQGVFQVNQSGTEWLPMNEGLEDCDVIALASDDDSLYALTASNVYQRDDDRWVSLGLPQSSLPLAAKYQDWVSNRVGIPAEALEIKREVTSMNRGIDADLAFSPTVLAVQNGSLYLGSADGLWIYTAAGWKRAGLDGTLITAITPGGLPGQVWAVACTFEECSLFTTNGSQWEMAAAEVSMGAIHAILPVGRDLLLATEGGIYRSAEASTAWEMVGAPGEQIMALAQSPRDACELAAAGQGVVILSRDCGTTWQSFQPDLPTWQYQAIAFDPQTEGVLLLGSMQAGAFMLPLE